MLTREAFQSPYDQGPGAVYALSTALEQHVAELETRLNKDSHNSSKPPSSDGLGRSPFLVPCVQEPGVAGLLSGIKCTV